MAMLKHEEDKLSDCAVVLTEVLNKLARASKDRKEVLEVTCAVMQCCSVIAFWPVERKIGSLE